MDRDNINKAKLVVGISSLTFVSIILGIEVQYMIYLFNKLSSINGHLWDLKLFWFSSIVVLLNLILVGYCIKLIGTIFEYVIEHYFKKDRLK